MAINFDAFTTYLGRGFKKDTLVKAARDSVTQGNGRVNEYGIFEITTGVFEEIKFPISFILNGKQNWVIDVRNYSSKSKENMGEFVVNESDPNYKSLLIQALLTKTWNDNNPLSLKDICPQAMVVYGKWISESIANRFGLDIRDTLIIDCLSQYYFLTQFQVDTDQDSEFRDYSLIPIQQVGRINSNLSKEVISNISSPITGLEDFVNLIKLKVNSPRLDNFSAPLLLTLISKTWYGINSNFNLGVALEFPPLLYTLIYQAINESLYRRAGFTRIVDKALKQSDKLNTTTIIKTITDDIKRKY